MYEDKIDIIAQSWFPTPTNKYEDFFYEEINPGLGFEPKILFLLDICIITYLTSLQCCYISTLNIFYYFVVYSIILRIGYSNTASRRFSSSATAPIASLHSSRHIG